MRSSKPPHASDQTAAPVLLSERDGEIAMLTLNRPEARNSLSEALLAALSEAWRDIAGDTSDPRRGAGGQWAGLLRRP